MNVVTKSSVSLDAAHEILERGRTAALKEGIPVAIAVLDEAGVLKAFLRTDGAGPMSSRLAIEKAYTSCTSGMTTQALGAFFNSDDILKTTMSVQPGMSPVPGGAPILLDGAVVGAVGVSGGHYLQDAAIADAAVQEA